MELPSLAHRFPPGDVSQVGCSFASARAGVVFGHLEPSGPAAFAGNTAFAFRTGSWQTVDPEAPILALGEAQMPPER